MYRRNPAILEEGGPYNFRDQRMGNKQSKLCLRREGGTIPALKLEAEAYFNSYRLELMRTQSLPTLIIILPISAFMDSVGSVLWCNYGSTISVNQYLSFFTDTYITWLYLSPSVLILIYKVFFYVLLNLFFLVNLVLINNLVAFAATHANTHSLYLVDRNGRVSVNQIQFKSERL